jgi:hypothetical protein
MSRDWLTEYDIRSRSMIFSSSTQTIFSINAGFFRQGLFAWLKVARLPSAPAQC